MKYSLHGEDLSVGQLQLCSIISHLAMGVLGPRLNWRGERESMLPVIGSDKEAIRSLSGSSCLQLDDICWAKVLQKQQKSVLKVSRSY